MDRPSELAPGMDYVLRAGEAIDIKDNENNVISIVAREGEKTIEFLVAFDNWFSAKNQGLVGPVMDVLASTMEAAFHSLPLEVQQTLPSYHALSVVVGKR